MFRLIILTLVPVLLVKLVASGHSSPSNPRGPNSRIVKNLTKIESSVSRLIRTQDLEEASSSRNAALNYRVPPVIVDKTTPHPHRTTGLKTGYFPPSTRVMPRVSHIEAECRDDFMKLRVAFNDSFAGLIYSAGYTHDHDCMYINGTGTNTYEFYIQLNRCGTLGGSDHHKREVKNKTPTKNYMWNTVTIQYNPLIEEEWDEHFKVTCEYGYDFWKTVTFPFLEVDRSQLELSRTKRHFHY